MDSEKAALKEENSKLKEELEDLQILYDSTVEHGVAIEEELADKNDALEETQERLQKELDQAANYVISLFPQKIQEGPIQTDWIFVPSTELGGDSFGYHFIDDDHFAIYLLDVCGHGVGAALLSATAINVLRSAALPNTDFTDPASVLAGLNRAFQMEKQNNMYFTIWYGCYSLSSKKLRYASGGHPPALLQSNDNIEELGIHQLIIGAMEDVSYQEKELSITPGDALFVFSDGIYEIVKTNGEDLSFDEFKIIFAGQKEKTPASTLLTMQAVQGHKHFEDDFSLLKITF